MNKEHGLYWGIFTLPEAFGESYLVVSGDAVPGSDGKVNLQHQSLPSLSDYSEPPTTVTSWRAGVAAYKYFSHR